NGGSIPGIRPGRPTSDYITRVLNRITLIGAFFLGFIAVFPMIINMVSGGQMVALAFGGSSLLIVVGVALETVRDLEAQMSLRHYKGFLE
ncbi:MAG: preprotein translocase subunit SecY, partial [Clostridia bacterium]|nr:preprotein translocase subunit SecY [Clostridia bacterium]